MTRNRNRNRGGAQNRPAGTPAGARQPQDHRPKRAKASKVDGGWTVTVRDITVTVPEEALNDFELLEQLDRLENKQFGASAPVFRMLLGEDAPRVLERLRGKNGRVPADQAMAFVQDVLAAINPES